MARGGLRGSARIDGGGHRQGDARHSGEGVLRVRPDGGRTGVGFEQPH